MDISQSPRPNPSALVRQLNRHLSDAQREDLLQWSRELLAIRASGAPPLEKARRALDVTYRAKVVLAILSGAGNALKQVAWDDRSWAARLGMGGAAFAVAAFGTQGAGIAALGTAIGVPLWIVLGAGGTFARTLIDDLQRSLEGRSRPGALADGEEILDAEWELLDKPSAAGALPAATSSGVREGETGSEPLWDVFRRAYREARARQGPTDQPAAGSSPDMASGEPDAGNETPDPDR